MPAFSRRRFLRALGQGTLLAALPAPLLATEAGAVTISILHTTDLHGHILPTVDYEGHTDLGGLARCATQIRNWQRVNPANILIDLGDVYQGTEVGLLSHGATMIQCLNALRYDAWVAGNHEFDWGLDAFAACVGLSSMPVLSGNALVDGRPAGAATDGPLAKMRRYLIKDVGGFRIAIASLTTPALSTWLPPEFRRGFELLDPVEILRTMLPEIASHRPDAIVLACHMGLKWRDDTANRIGALTQEFPQLAACLGAHTHQNHPGEKVNGVLYAQADHYGIHAGKLDLIFDRDSRRLLRVESATVPMDHAIALDPLILSIAQPDLKAADAVLAREIGELTEPFGASAVLGHPSDAERLIASAIMAALRNRGVEVDAVAHGLFDHRPLMPGRKTVADAWTVIPYENEIVTVDLSREDLFAFARDCSHGADFRNLMGWRVTTSGTGPALQVDVRASDGSPLPEKSRYRVALNSYDAQSGGERFPVVARLAAHPANHRVLYPIDIRGALIDFFVARGKVSRASLLV